jgi:hypothetical protein
MLETKDTRTFLTHFMASFGLGSFIGMATWLRPSETDYNDMKLPPSTVELAAKGPITRRPAIFDIPVSAKKLVSEESQKEVVKLFEREYPDLVVEKYGPWSDRDGNSVLRCVCTLRPKTAEQDD